MKAAVSFEPLQAQSPLNTSGIVPLGERVLVLPDQIEEKTSSGLIIATQAQLAREEMAQIEGTVIAVAPEAFPKHEDQPIRPGDRVIFAKYGGLIYGKENTKDGKTYRILWDDDVVAVLK